MKARLALTVIFIILVLTIIIWASAIDFEPLSLSYLRHFSLLFAAIGLVLIFMQFVFVSRIKAIEGGFGLDRMLRWHRFFGRVGLGFLWLHAVMIVLFRLIEFGDLFLSTFIWVGAAALLGFSVTAMLASLYKKLGLLYEIWRNIHLFNYLLFPFVLVHVFYYSVRTGSSFFLIWVLLAVLYTFLVVYRIVRILTIRRNPYEVIEVKQEAEAIWSLIFKGKRIDFRPGQFMIIQLLRNGRLSSPHPFTISSSPTRENLSITPKELGDFTSTIKETRVGDQALIDAPYGVFSFLNYRQDELVFIAGGIGITPFISMLSYICDQKLKLKVTLFWANRDESNLCFREELREMEKEMAQFKAILVMSDQPDWPGEKGFLNAGMIADYLGNLSQKDFFVCGPPPMIKAIIADLKKQKVLSSRIHTEIFEL